MLSRNGSESLSPNENPNGNGGGTGAPQRWWWCWRWPFLLRLGVQSVSASVLVFGAAAVGVRCWRQRQCRCQSASGTTGYYLAALADNAVVAGCVQQADGLGYFYVPSFFFSLFFSAQSIDQSCPIFVSTQPDRAGLSLEAEA